MMKTRLSAIAADAARRNAQAKNADVDRMLHRSMRALLPFDNPKTLTMINQAGRADSWPKSAFCDLDGIPRAGPWYPYERFSRHLWHLPRDYELAIRWLRPSFLTRDHWTPGRKGRDIHGITTLRYLDTGEAGLRAARSGECAPVCVRADGLRLRPYRQCPPGDRVRRAVPAAAASLWRDPCHLRPQHHRRRRQDQRAGC